MARERMNPSQRATLRRVTVHGVPFVEVKTATTNARLYRVMESRGFSSDYLQKPCYYFAQISEHGFVRQDVCVSGIGDRNPKDVMEFWSDANNGITVTVMNETYFAEWQNHKE